jgi:hypothetical protein
MRLSRMLKPPQVQFEIHQTHRLRFRNTAANPATAITWAMLCETVLVAGTATVAYQLYDFVRVKEVEMWCTAGGATAPAVTIGLDFAGLLAGGYGGGKSFEDTTVSNAYPAYLKCRPDPRSQAGQFQPNNASVAFHIRANNAAASTAIVDVTLEFRNSPLVSPVTASVSGATPGDIYFRGLDGLNTAATVWSSLMLPNII